MENKDEFIKKMDNDVAALSRMAADIMKRATFEDKLRPHMAHTYLLNVVSTFMSKVLAIYIASVKNADTNETYQQIYLEVQIALKKILERHTPDKTIFAIEIDRDGDFPLSKRICPSCKHVHVDGYANAWGPAGKTAPPKSTPESVATTNCAACGEYLMFDEKGALQRLPEEIWRKLPVEVQDEMTKLRSAIMLLKKYGFETSHPDVIQ